MAWKSKGINPASAKVGVSKAGEVSFDKWAGASYSSGKGILKTKTDGQSPKKQTDGNLSTKYSQKDTTGSNVRR